jgi:hypothetical protein
LKCDKESAISNSKINQQQALLEQYSGEQTFIVLEDEKKHEPNATD